MAPISLSMLIGNFHVANCSEANVVANSSEDGSVYNTIGSGVVGLLRTTLEGTRGASCFYSHSCVFWFAATNT